MRKLEGDGYPRLQMLLLVVLTGAAGMAASFPLSSFFSGYGCAQRRRTISICP